VATLLDGLGNAQKQLSLETIVGKFLPVKTTGTLPDDQAIWANELHPTPKGFKLLASKILVPVIKPFL